MGTEFVVGDGGGSLPGSVPDCGDGYGVDSGGGGHLLVDADGGDVESAAAIDEYDCSAQAPGTDTDYSQRPWNSSRAPLPSHVARCLHSESSDHSQSYHSCSRTSSAAAHTSLDPVLSSNRKRCDEFGSAVACYSPPGPRHDFAPGPLHYLRHRHCIKSSQAIRNYY